MPTHPGAPASHTISRGKIMLATPPTFSTTRFHCKRGRVLWACRSGPLTLNKTHRGVAEQFGVFYIVFHRDLDRGGARVDVL